MRPSLSLKALLRSPFKTLLTFLLIAAASFALFSRVADYAVTSRETNHAIDYYRGVAALDNGVKNTAQLLYSQMPNSMRYSHYGNTWPQLLTVEQIDALSTLPGVTSMDTRYMTGGITDSLKRVSLYGDYTSKYRYADRFVVEGTFVGYDIKEIVKEYPINLLNLTDCKLLAGNIPIYQGSDFSVQYYIDNDVYLSSGFELKDNPYKQDFVDRLVIGDRCLIIGRWESVVTITSKDDGGNYINSDVATEEWLDDEMMARVYKEWGIPMITANIGDQDTLDYVDSFHLLNGETENYLETEKFAKVKEIIDITNSDLQTFDMVYTSDMLSIPRFNERDMVIQEGRALTKEDTNACVVSLALMELNNLKIGDKLTVDLCDKLLMQNSEMGATAVIPERYGAVVDTVELEIVGAYMDTDAAYERVGADWWSYSLNTLFVPRSLLPVEVPDDYEVRPGEFSIVVDDARQMQAFLDAARPLAREMGLSLRFSDSGWLEVKDSINTGRTTSLITTVLFLGAAAVALLLAAYMYTARSKKSYAIMRALGTPRNKARNTIVLPLGVLSALAIPAGGITGMLYAHNAISAALESLAAANENYVPDASLPVVTMIVCFFCEIAFLALLSALFMRKLGKTPVLALLQGGPVPGLAMSAVGGDDRIAVANIVHPLAHPGALRHPSKEGNSPVLTPIPLLGGAPEGRGGYGSIRHVTRYILRHMRRAGLKSAIAVVLAVLLPGAMGLLAITRLSYQELFGEVEVKGTLSNFPSSSIIEASHSELMKDFYYSGGFDIICNGVIGSEGNLLALTNDFDRYAKARGSEYMVEYGSGFDSSLFASENAQCVIGGTLADKYGVKSGDSIDLMSFVMANVYLSLFPDELQTNIEQSSRTFTVAGVIRSDDKYFNEGIFAPLSVAVAEIGPDMEYPFAVELSEFTLVNNDEPYELQDYLYELSRVEYKYTETVTYNLNTVELDNIKRVRDMLIMFFPIAVAAAVLIGLTAPLLIIMQSLKEAAIMRVLGTTKFRARCMLAFEQMSLCVFGLVIAAFALVMYNSGLFVRSADTLTICGGLYLISCACAAAFAAMAVTRHKVLELLQVKE